MDSGNKSYLLFIFVLSHHHLLLYGVFLLADRVPSAPRQLGTSLNPNLFQDWQNVSFYLAKFTRVVVYSKYDLGYGGKVIFILT